MSSWSVPLCGEEESGIAWCMGSCVVSHYVGKESVG